MLPVVPRTDTNVAYPTIPELLPHNRNYTLIVGGVEFQLSGASLSYDSPSYFTDYFLKNPNERSLTIERSGKVFEKVLLHLQGYSIEIDNDFEWLYLLSESTYFSLQKLRNRLISEGIIVNVSNQIFKIPQEVFMNRSGNHPNLFTLLHNNIINDPLIGKSKSVFLRPPPFSPIITNKNPEIFKQLLNGIYGNEIIIHNEKHRRDLIKDCKYYQFFELEQRLIPVDIKTNPFTGDEEIVIKFEDIKKHGLLNNAMNNLNQLFSRVQYSRPHLDVNYWRDLVVQFDSTDLSIRINPALNFFQLVSKGKYSTKFGSFIREISDDFNLNKETNELSTYCDIQMANVNLNGMKMESNWLSLLNNSTSFNSDPNKLIEVNLFKSQWRINVTGRSKLLMECVKFDGVLDEYHFNEARKFL